MATVIGASGATAAAAGLTTIENPGGGKIVYGAVSGASSLQDAMVQVLRTVHGEFGDRPEIGRFFQARSSNSLATFFTVVAKRLHGEPMAGLVIVSLPPDGHAIAAVLYDQAARFRQTEPAMMKTLNKAWRSGPAMSAGRAPASPAAAAPAPARERGPQRLRMATGGDRSASIGLPPGWWLTMVRGGKLMAEGPNGEMVGLGLIYEGLRFPVGNLFQSFVTVTNHFRAGARQSPGTFRLTSSENLGGGPGEAGAVQVLFEVDYHDGRGPRKGSARLQAALVRGLPTWALTVSTSNAPVRVASAESQTMMAVIRSYSQNSAVINRLTSETVGQIEANQAAANARVREQDARNDDSNRAFDAHMKDIDGKARSFDSHNDDIDRQSRSFENYQLDRTIIQDNDYNERATTGNRLGDALVKANPDRFEYVKTQDFIKGVDY